MRPSSPPANTHTPRGSDAALLVALAALLGVRMLIAESTTRLSATFLSAASASLGPTPATSVLLDLATLIFASIALRDVRLRSGVARGAAAAIAALLLAVVASTFAASDKRVAANAGASLVISVLAVAALVHLARRTRLGAILVIAAVACASLNASKSLMQVGYEFDDTLDYWQKTQKPALIAAGADATDPAIVNYERRLRSQNAFGMLAHPNVAASIMMAGALPLLAVILQRHRSATGTACAFLLLAAIAVATYFTGSKGALLALGAGVIVEAALHVTRLRRTRVLLGAYVAACAALAGHGLYHGTLPGDSLAFRWEYWTAAARAMPAAMPLGLGRDNFQAAYLRYKADAATEEVRDPHDVWVSLLIELGPLGLLCGAALAVLIIRVLMCALSGRATPALHAASSRAGSTTDTVHFDRSAARLAALTIAAVVLLHAIASGTPFAQPGVALLWFVEFAGLLAAIACVAALAIRHASNEAIQIGCIAAIAALFIHAIVDFALLTPAGLSMLGLLAAGALGLFATAESPAGAGAPRTLPLVAGVAGCAALAWWIVLPTLRGEAALDDATRKLPQTRGEPSAVSALFEPAIRADAWSADAPRIAAAALHQLADAPGSTPGAARRAVQLGLSFVQLARQRDPKALAAIRLAARLECSAARLDESPLAWRRAAQAWDEAVAAYPSSPPDRIAAADAWVNTARATTEEQHRASAAGRAREHLDHAERIDAFRPAESASKLGEKERREIARLRALAENPAP